MYMQSQVNETVESCLGESSNYITYEYREGFAIKTLFVCSNLTHPSMLAGQESLAMWTSTLLQARLPTTNMCFKKEMQPSEQCTHEAIHVPWYKSQA